MYFAYMRPFALSRRVSNNPTNAFFLSFAGKDVVNIGKYLLIYLCH